ncbi:lactate utilization protein C [Helicobacter sp. 11S03491-1]|uniref:LutC/YkgG family protein n=1 Tax=Helicobacter sp. 11S03491-1 TaxID=1476196 RepID=UPI000BA79DFF|nr:lactate utilization protein C [Helicobacter sp. 11S03491-1]PAF41555.1 lactate utilization protein C [Helicobacter sp. 11S03491-1]
MSKIQILNRIRSALNNNHIPSFDPHYKDILKYENTDLLQEYKRLQIANKAKVIQSQDLSRDVLDTLVEIEAKKVLYTLDLPFDIKDLEGNFETIAYDKKVEAIRSELFGIDTSIVKAVCGVANLGIIGIASSPYSPRLASLITLNCIILLDKNNIVPNLFEGTQMLKSKANKGILPANLLFIAGPSRTADIELQTVFGVHGPQNVSVILY